MNWTMEIKTAACEQDGWRPVRPSGGEPYVYETAEKAADALRIFYPDQLRRDRLNRCSRETRVRNTATGETRDAWRWYP